MIALTVIGIINIGLMLLVGCLMVRLNKKLNKIVIDDKIPELQKFFAERDEILAVYLYGSYGTEYQTKMSDVDMAVLLIPAALTTLDYQLELSAQIAEIIKEEDLDLLILNSASIVMKFEVLSTGKLLYERDHDQVCDFLERVLKEYGDFQIDLKQFYREYDEALREKYSNGQQQ